MVLICSLAGAESPRNLPGVMTNRTDSYIYSGQPGGKALVKDRLDHRSPSRILVEDFLGPDGRVREDAIRKWLERVDEREAAAFLVFCQRQATSPALCRAPRSALPARLLADWQANRMHVVYGFLRERFSLALELGRQLPPLNTPSALNSWPAQDFYEALFDGLDAFAAMQAEDATLGRRWEYYLGLKDLLRDVSIQQQPEATNLVPPAIYQNAFVEPDQLMADGYDLSRMDPYDSGFWRRPIRPIRLFDTTNYDRRTEATVGPEMLDPFQPIDVDFAGGSPGGFTPKCQVSYQGRRYKMKFKVPVPRPAEAGTLLGAIDNFVANHFETQTEPVVNNLAAALGFTVDPTYFKRWIRLYLPDDGFQPWEEQQNAERFGRARERMIARIREASRVETVETFGWEFEKAFPNENIGSDAQGRFFLNVPDVSLELSSGPTQVGLDLFRKADLGRSLKREFRAFVLFHAWVNDVDTKDSNAEVKLIKSAESDQFRLVYSVSDMGATLGSAFNFLGKNRPNDLDYDLVRRTVHSRDERLQKVVLTYRTHYRGPIFEAVSIQDARWFVRRLAQLTPHQIRQAFTASGYRDPVRELYTQKLLRRRDQLVAAFLRHDAEVIEDGTGERIKVEMLSAIEDPARYVVAGFEEHFKAGQLISVPEGEDAHWTQSFSSFGKDTPQRELVENGAHLLAAAGLRPVGQALQRIPLTTGGFVDGVAVGLDSFLPARYLVENPNKDPQAPFWLVDVFRVGLSVSAREGLWSRLAEIRFLGSRLPAEAKLLRVHELVRVRPVQNPAENYEGLWKNYRPSAALKSPFEKVQLDFLDRLQSGDVVVASTYVGAGFTIRNAIPPLPWLVSGAEIGGGTHRTLVDRVWMQKQEGSQLAVAWEKRHDFQLAGFAGLDLILFQERFLQIERNLDERRLLSGVVNLSEEEQRDWLAANLWAGSSSREEDEQWTKTEIRSETNRRLADFFGLQFGGSFNRSSRTVTRSRGEQVAELVEAARGRIAGSRQLNLFPKLDLRIEGEAMVGDREIFAQFKLNYRKPFASREDFGRMKKRYLPLAHSDLLLFAPQDVNEYLGTLRLGSRLLFSPAALDDILSTETAVACREFARRIPARDPESWCNQAPDIIDPHLYALRTTADPVKQQRLRTTLTATKSFITDFDTARIRFQRYRALSEAERGTDVRKALAEALARLVYGNHLPNLRVATLRSLTSPERVYHFASSSSSLGGFPGHEYIVELNKNARGNAALVDDLERLRSQSDPPMTATIDGTLDSLFFNFLERQQVTVSIR